MVEYYSSVNPEILLFTINRKEAITKSRTDISPETEYLQCASKSLSKGESFPPHKHKELRRESLKTQEAWVFLSGKVKAKFYDIDDTLYFETYLGAGDCTVVFNAGHGFEVVEDDTILYEFKIGPYYGIAADKVPIGDLV
jgi:mannose-6-phosphate isomerase-like protein (cupin superfamily)